MTKVLKLVWFVTLFAGLAALLWTYATVSLNVNVFDNQLGRESFFYVSLIVLTAVNFLLYFLSTQDFSSQYTFIKPWQYSFGIVINAFYIVSVLFIGLLGSAEPYNYSNFGYLIIFFLGLMIAWLLALPFLYLLLKNR